MDASRFTEKRTGQLARITTADGPDWAFVPDPLPPKDWEFPADLWPLLAEAREQLARLDEKGRTVPNPTLLLDPLQKREALRSSSLEGTYATAKELLLYELNPREPTSREDKANDWREVYNYDQSLRHGVRAMREQSSEGLPLTLRLIRDMHRTLLEDVRGNDRRAGQFRDRQVHVGSNRRFVPTPPGEPLRQCLEDFESYLHSHTDHLDPLVRSYVVHYQFEAIHPFLDGNGRVGRLLLSLTTFQWNRLHLPWLYMSAYFERYKDEYVDNMFAVSTHGDWDTWIEFCLRGTVEQCKDAIRRCDALNALRVEMHQKLDRWPRMGHLVDLLFVNPVFTASEVARWANTSMPTARRDIDILLGNGFAKYLTGEKPRRFYVPRILSAAYSEEDRDTEVLPDVEPPSED